MDFYGSTTVAGKLPAVSSRLWLVGLCPLILAADSLLKGLALGIAVLAAASVSVTLVRLLRHWLPRTARLAGCALIIAGVVSAIDLCFRALAFEFHLALGLFLPLIATNSVILARADRLATRGDESLRRPGWLREGGLILLVPGLCGAARELLGHGRLLGDVADFFGDGAATFALHLDPDGGGFALALQPAGAFFLLALLVVLVQLTASRRNPP